MIAVLERLQARNEWTFIKALPEADPVLAASWWTLLLMRGLLPALFAIAMGLLVGAVQRGEPLAGALGLVGTVFVLMQVLGPAHLAVGANLGSRTAAYLYDRLTMACVEPPGMGHLENPELTNDLTMSRDFDLGISGPPLSTSMDFIASGLVEMVAGLASAAVLAAYAWWAPLLLAGAWLGTHWLLRESGVWKDRETDEVREAQRHADYAYRLAVDPPAAKELRLFGLATWTVERFRGYRRHLFELRWEATRLRQRPVLWSLLLVLFANLVVFASLALAAADGTLGLDRMVTFASAAVSTSMIAFGGLSWALDGAAAPAAAVLRLQDAMRRSGALVIGDAPAAQLPAREVRFRNVRFAYPSTPDTEEPVLQGFDLTIPAGSSLAIVGKNGPVKPPSRNCSADSTIQLKAASKLTASTCAVWISRRGATGLPQCFRTSCVSSCPCATTLHPPGHPMRSFSAPWSRPARPGLPTSIRFWRAVTLAGLTCPVGSGSALRWPGHCARCSAAPVWYCWTNPPRNSTCAAKRRSSIASSPLRATSPRF